MVTLSVDSVQIDVMESSQLFRVRAGDDRQEKTEP